MSKEKIIKRIAIEIAGVTVEVTPKQARDLQEALTELLGMEAKETVVKHEYYPRYWYNGGTYTIKPSQVTTVTPVWYHSTTGTVSTLLNETTDTVTVKVY